MATYHLRVKNDTQPSGIKVSATISTGKEHKVKKRIAFSKTVSCLNGQRVQHKNFLARQIVTRVRETGGIKKSNCLYPTN